MPSVIDYAHYHAQRKEAKALALQATADVEKFARDLQARYDIPIRVQEKPGLRYRAINSSFWSQLGSPDCHLVWLDRLESWERPYLLGHELIHLAMECEAQAKGERRTVLGSPDVLARLADGLSGGLKNFPREMYTMSTDLSLDMWVETRLRRDFPNLRPAQFVFLNRDALREARNGLRLDGAAFEQPRFNYLAAVLGARALYKDRLFGTRHFSRFVGMPMQDLAEQLYNAFVELSPCPGAQFRLIERWDELGGFPGLHVMVPLPAWEIDAVCKLHIV